MDEGRESGPGIGLVRVIQGYPSLAETPRRSDAAALPGPIGPGPDPGPRRYPRRFMKASSP